MLYSGRIQLIGVVPGAILVTIGAIPPAVSMLMIGGSVLALYGLLLPLQVAWMQGTLTAFGSEVTLLLDESGIHGWPAPNRHAIGWFDVNRLRVRGGVIIFVGSTAFGSWGRDWVPIPERALSADERLTLAAYLSSVGFTLPGRKSGAVG